MSFIENIVAEEVFDNTVETKRSRSERSSTSARKYERFRPKRQRLSGSEATKGQTVDNVLGVIVDNGAYSLKTGLSTDKNPNVMPNCIMKAKSERKRLFIGNQINECRDCSGVYFLLPCERGYITKWDVQKPVWDYVFSKNICPINDNPVLMTQPLFNFKAIQDCIDEIFFEEYEVTAMYRANPTDFAKFKYSEEHGNDATCIIVDSGFSFTHVIPYINGKKYLKGIKRINVGGKLLTNHLKDIISYRQYHVMEETFVINQVKEDTCFVSEDFKRDLKIAESKTKNTIVRNYVLPDFNAIRRGYIHDPSKEVDKEEMENFQVLRLNNERFSVPEILFHPSDIGIKSMGVAEAVAKAILLCPSSYHKQLAKNIVIIGGNINFPGFKTRVYNEIRSLVPDTWEINIYQPDNPTTYAWEGGKSILRNPDLKSMLVTKEAYEEHGSNITQKLFNDWSSVPEEQIDRKKEIQPISFLDHIKNYNIFGKADSTEESPEPSNNEVFNNQDLSKPEAGPSKPSTSEDSNKSVTESALEENAEASNSTSDSFKSEVAKKNMENNTEGKSNKSRRGTRKTITDEEVSLEEPAEDEDDFISDDIFPFGVSYL